MTTPSAQIDRLSGKVDSLNHLLNFIVMKDKTPDSSVGRATDFSPVLCACEIIVPLSYTCEVELKQGRVIIRIMCLIFSVQV